jgi:DNA-binding NarL/FixJ family response regulator
VKAKPRLLLAEDHELFSEGLRAMLGKEYSVLGVVRDGGEVIAAVRKHQPDVLLLDLSLPHRTGMDLLGDLKELNPAPRVVVVTMHVDSVLVDAAIRLGASAFVPKDASLDELRTAIEEVLEGRRYLSPRLPRRGRRGPEVDRLGFSRLTPRQQSIVRMIGQGMTTEQMAATLGLSPFTISHHRKSIRQQLGLDSDWAMLRYAILVGLSDEPPEPEAKPNR